MTRQILISFILFIILIAGCSHNLTSKKVVKNDIEMLYGPVSLEQIYFDYPEWQEIFKNYQPDGKYIQQLKQIEARFEVKIFLATWCSDSRREVPHFFKILNEAELNSKADIQMWAVDRKLKMNSSLTEDYNIERVATFVFLREGKEIGRIVESPDYLTLEEHILEILRQK